MDQLREPCKPLKEWPRTLRLGLLDRTNIAVGSDLPITSWMVRHAAWLLSHFQAGAADGKTAYAPQFEKPHESPVLPFAERVMWKDPTLQPAKLRSSWGYGLWLGRTQTSNAHLIGTRLGIGVARTIRRLPASEREEASLVVTMRGTPVSGRPADVAAGDAPSVSRHAGERKEVIVVHASSGAPMQGSSGEGASAYSNPVPNLPKPMVERTEASPVEGESSQNPRGEKAASLSDDAPMELTHAVEPTAKSRAPVEEHEESLAPKRQRGRHATHAWPSPGSPEYTVACPRCDGRSYRHLTRCQLKRRERGLPASSSSRDALGDTVMSDAPTSMEEASLPPPPAEPPPEQQGSTDTDAMVLAAVHPYGHEEPVETSRIEFESIVRYGFCFEEDTLEELHLDEVAEGVNRELDLMKSFPVHQAVPRTEATGKFSLLDGAAGRWDPNK